MKMKFEMNAKIPKFKNLNALLTRSTQTVLEAGAKEFALTTAKNVPVWSGMARSTLVPLGRHLGVTIPFDPIKGETATKNKAAGESAGRDFSIIATATGGTFRWATNVKHFFLNEQFNMSRVASSPWFSIRRGRNAALAVMKEIAKKVFVNNIKASISYEETK
jgi:hypothetical protein